ncbi:MAG: DEAD/DEAH box helicase [Kiritimatiellae bacterium]|nr:DEAD/DEAH box helicase [Kiritimatiellia bacterium]
MQLRPYQKACLETIRDRYAAGIRRQLISLPTGTGKTVIFAQLPSFFRMKKRMLVLAHREELLEQARDKLLRANPALQVDIEQAGRRAQPDSRIVVASVPTLGRKHSARLERLDPEEFYLLVVDEAHHATAATYRRTLEHFGVFETGTPKLLLGFTATPKRGDGQGLDAVFEEISFSRNLPQMVEDGYLAPLAAYRVETDVDLSGVKTRMGDFVAAQLSRAVNVQERNELVVTIYRDRLAGRQTLCFCVDVAHAHSLADSFRRAGIPTGCVTGDMPREARAQALAEFGSGAKTVLTNCMVLTEGYDEPAVSGIILARPTKSALLYVQMIGRGTRLHPGKEDVTIIDIVDLTRDQKLVNLATLFGLPTQFDMEGRTTKKVQEALEWVERNRPWVRLDQVRSLSDLRYRCQRVNLFDLDTPEELEYGSDYAWAQQGMDRYVLRLAKGDALTVYPTILGEWEVALRDAGVERSIAHLPGLEAAVAHADEFVAAHRRDSIGLVNRHSRWRREPASEKQLAVLKARGIQAPKRLTKGQASHLIGMLPRR